MTKLTWQLTEALSAIIFDCDGTLSRIEGIDELAKQNNVTDEVQFLTQEAMSKTGINPDLYKKRLDLVLPNLQQVLKLGEDYFQHRVPHILEVIKILRLLNKSVYIVSAGLTPAVQIFGQQLGVPPANIFAVDIEFDSGGRFQSYDSSSPLVHNQGKLTLVTKIKEHHPRFAYIGDGLNDVIVRTIATRFIGYGGTFFRQNIADLSQFYLTTHSMSPLLPLVLTAAESAQLKNKDLLLYQEGVQAIADHKVLLLSSAL